MSSKNILQEYCQKNKIAIPTYNNNKKEGTVAHLPLWNSVVNFEGKDYESKGWWPKKSTADCDAAQVVLDFIDKNLPKVEEIKNEIIVNMRSIKLKKNTEDVILIDIENIPEDIFTEDTIKINATVYGVCGHNSPLLKKKYNYPIIAVESAISDAADHGLTFVAGILSTKVKDNACFYVVTNDHYGEITMRLLEQMQFRAQYIPSSKLYILQNSNIFFKINGRKNS